MTTQSNTPEGKVTAEEIYSRRFNESDTPDGYFITPNFETSLSDEIIESMKEYASLQSADKDKENATLREFTDLAVKAFISGKYEDMGKALEYYYLKIQK